MANGLCECGWGQPSNQDFAPGHDSEALRMLLHLDGVLDRDEPVADFLHRRAYGRGGRNLRREYQDRTPAHPCRPVDAPGLAAGQLTRVAHDVGRDVLKRPVSVGP